MIRQKYKIVCSKGIIDPEIKKEKNCVFIIDNII